jgi:ATP-binding cassette, subfamily B, bacterial PglK
MTRSDPSASLRSLLVRFWGHLSPRRRRQYVMLMALMVVSAFAELASLSAVFPFLGVLTAPDRVFSRPLLAHAAHALGILTPAQLALPLTLGFAVVVVVAALIRTLLLWSSTRVAFASGSDLSMEVYRRTLYQSYAVHVARNSSEVISGITSKVHDVVFGVLVPLITLISSTVLVATVAAALIAFNPKVALTVIAVFGVSYGVTSQLTRRKLRANSDRIAAEQTQVIKSLQEGLGGIRDVLLDGSQPVYCEAYRQADHRLRLAQGSNQFVGSCPRFATEALGMLLIAALAYVMSRQSGGITSQLPILAALALGAQRLLPAMQQAHSAWASITGHHASLMDAIDLLEQPVPPEMLQPPPAPLRLRESIRLDSVCFKYQASGPWILDGLSLTIRKGEETVRAWQQNIAHVPQAIYLSDATLAENIAFGVPLQGIDMARVRSAAAKAQIAAFVESCPRGYQEMVGERGIRLSGGQRQRIAIARALYKQARVLVFDEATSALDSITEQSVMDAIEGLSDDLTILLIAHRLSTVRRCDTIVQLEGGRVVAQGSYDQLLERSASFRELAVAGPNK